MRRDCGWIAHDDPLKTASEPPLSLSMNRCLRAARNEAMSSNHDAGNQTAGEGTSSEQPPGEATEPTAEAGVRTAAGASRDAAVAAAKLTFKTDEVRHAKALKAADRALEDVQQQLEKASAEFAAVTAQNHEAAPALEAAEAQAAAADEAVMAAQRALEEATEQQAARAAEVQAARAALESLPAAVMAAATAVEDLTGALAIAESQREVDRSASGVLHAQAHETMLQEIQKAEDEHSSTLQASPDS